MSFSVEEREGETIYRPVTYGSNTQVSANYGSKDLVSSMYRSESLSSSESNWDTQETYVVITDNMSSTTSCKLLIPIIDVFILRVTSENEDIIKISLKDHGGSIDSLLLVDAVLVLPYYLHSSGNSFVDKRNEELDSLLRKYISVNHRAVAFRMSSIGGVYRTIVVKKFEMETEGECVIF